MGNPAKRKVLIQKLCCMSTHMWGHSIMVGKKIVRVQSALHLPAGLTVHVPKILRQLTLQEEWPYEITINYITPC
jgi:hypothetical protein